MNIYEEEHLEKKFQQVTDLIGYLLLDLLVVSLMKVNSENRIFKEFEEARADSFVDDPKF
jgi:hypothetical protein